MREERELGGVGAQKRSCLSLGFLPPLSGFNYRWSDGWKVFLWRRWHGPKNPHRYPRVVGVTQIFHFEN